MICPSLPGKGPNFKRVDRPNASPAAAGKPACRRLPGGRLAHQNPGLRQFTESLTAAIAAHIISTQRIPPQTEFTSQACRAGGVIAAVIADAKFMKPK